MPSAALPSHASARAARNLRALAPPFARGPAADGAGLPADRGGPRVTFYGGGGDDPRHPASRAPARIPKENQRRAGRAGRPEGGGDMHAQVAIVACLAFSGFSALVYQVLWTRLLGLAFGTTTEAIGTVLAVFFGGLALGNLLAARWTLRLRHPLRAYAVLELAIGVFARRLAAGARAPGEPGLGLGRRARAGRPRPRCAAWSLRPCCSRPRSRWGRRSRWSRAVSSARMPASGGPAPSSTPSNTLGAVLGAYLCGFWMIPALGIARSVLVAAAANLVVAAVALRAARGAAPAAPIRRRLRSRALRCAGRACS